MEKRKDIRIDVPENVKGKLYNVVNFRVKNISLGGLNILSNFQPNLNTNYTIYLSENKTQQDFQIRVIRIEVDSLITKETDIFSAGTIFSIAARFESLNSSQNHFLESFIKKRTKEQNIGLIAKEKS